MCNLGFQCYMFIVGNVLKVTFNIFYNINFPKMHHEKLNVMLKLDNIGYKVKIML